VPVRSKLAFFAFSLAGLFTYQVSNADYLFLSYFLLLNIGVCQYLLLLVIVVAIEL